MRYQVLERPTLIGTMVIRLRLWFLTAMEYARPAAFHGHLSDYQRRDIGLKCYGFERPVVLVAVPLKQHRVRVVRYPPHLSPMGDDASVVMLPLAIPRGTSEW